MATYRLTSPAAQDVADILDYVASSSGESRADSVASRMHTRFQRLAIYPQSGQSRPEFGPGIRSVAVQSWMVYYRASNQDDQVEIIRVLHAARDQMAAMAAPQGD